MQNHLASQDRIDLTYNITPFSSDGASFPAPIVLHVESFGYKAIGSALKSIGYKGGLYTLKPHIEAVTIQTDFVLSNGVCSRICSSVAVAHSIPNPVELLIATRLVAACLSLEVPHELPSLFSGNNGFVGEFSHGISSFQEYFSKP
jgi:hypothetical protein